MLKAEGEMLGCHRGYVPPTYLRTPYAYLHGNNSQLATAQKGHRQERIIIGSESAIVHYSMKEWLLRSHPCIRMYAVYRIGLYLF